jgi:hypothetical protein
VTEAWPPNPIPTLPPQIVQAAQEGRLVIFVGAGISRLMGCPSWEQLADRCITELAHQRLLTFGEAEQLQHLDAKKRLTIALQIAKAGLASLDFVKFIQPDRLLDCRVYEYLRAIGCVYVTTNYDNFMDRPPLRTEVTTPSGPSSPAQPAANEIICRPDQFTAQHLRRPGAVVHLHGSVTAPESMIITTPDYLRHYENAHVRQFLGELFSQYTVLFIGYGLAEWEILEYVLRRQGASILPSRFMLEGYFSHQEKLFNSLNQYFSDSFGVRICAFSRDNRNHEQLVHVVEDWAGRLRAGKPILADDLDFVLRAARE